MSENTEAPQEVTDNLDSFATEFFGQNKVVPAKTNATEVQDDTAGSDDGADESQNEVDPNADLEAEFKEAPPKKKTVQDRINEVVAQREELKRDFETREAALRKEFEDFKKGANPVQPLKEATEPTPDDIQADGTAKYPLGEFDPAYIRDLTKHVFAQERVAAEAVAAEQYRNMQAKQAQEQATAQWNEKLETAKTEYPDLQEKGVALLNNFNNLEPNYAAYLSGVLMSMDKGPEVLYYLSNHPDEAFSIVNSGAQKATLALGRIESKFLDADAEKQLAKPKLTKAPPPPTERARGSNGAFVSISPDTDDLDAFGAEFFKKK